jgi:type IV secretory pathway TrbL component
MNVWHKLVLIGAVAATVSMVGAAVANADQHIDFGTNQAACKSAASQANATGHSGSFCFQTGPGYYALNLGD